MSSSLPQAASRTASSGSWSVPSAVAAVDGVIVLEEDDDKVESEDAGGDSDDESLSDCPLHVLYRLQVRWWYHEPPTYSFLTTHFVLHKGV
jgi:hypothetical protein